MNLNKLFDQQLVTTVLGALVLARITCAVFVHIVVTVLALLIVAVSRVDGQDLATNLTIRVLEGVQVDVPQTATQVTDLFAGQLHHA